MLEGALEAWNDVRRFRSQERFELPEGEVVVDVDWGPAVADLERRLRHQRAMDALVAGDSHEGLDELLSRFAESAEEGKRAQDQGITSWEMSSRFLESHNVTVPVSVSLPSSRVEWILDPMGAVAIKSLVHSLYTTMNLAVPGGGKFCGELALEGGGWREPLQLSADGLEQCWLHSLERRA